MNRKTAGKELLAAVSEEQYEKLVEMATESKSKKSHFSFGEILKGLKDDEIDKMWQELSALVLKRGESISQKASSPTKKERQDENHFLHAAIDLAFAIFEERLPASQSLLQLILSLNRTIFEIPANLESLRNSFVLLCEKMYLSNYHNLDHELIMSNSVIYLLTRSLLPKATKKIIKRIYMLRALLPKILKVESNEVWSLLIHCVVSPLYLSMPEGQKIIACILSMDPHRVSEVHAQIRKVLQTAPVKHGVAYGRVFFESWNYAVKQNLGVLKNNIEVLCLQDIILMGVKARQKSLVMTLRKVMSPFHSQKKEQHVSKMLYLLFHPILWRYIKHSNGLIRDNTAQLFLDFFPLEDPDGKLYSSDLELNEQMLLIKDLLLDEFPIVRCTSVIGLCIALSLHWELFNDDIIRTYFKIIINDLSRDSSSAEVRCSVAKGFKVLLENPLTYPTLSGLLPEINGLFHDISDPVRVAFCQLLLKVKKISAIKYFEVVEQSHLLARLEMDPVIAKSIVNLIHNSYFPKDRSAEIWLIRCSHLVRNDRGASRVFFQHVTSFVDLEQIAKFMVYTVKAIHFYVKHKVAERRMCTLTNTSYLEDTADIEAEMDFLENENKLNDPVVVSGLLDAVSILWLSSLGSLEKPENKNMLKFIVAKLSKCLGDLSLYYKDTEVWESVYYLGSFMPARAIPSLASLCFYRIQRLEVDAKPEEYMTLMECLCNQGESASLLVLLKEWVEQGFQPIPVTPVPKKRKRNPKAENDTPAPVLRHNLAAEILNSMLQHRSCQKTLITRHPETMTEFLGYLDEIKRRIELSYEESITPCEANFLTQMLYALMKTAVLLNIQQKPLAIKFVEDVIRWFQEKILKISVNPCGETSLNTSSTRSMTRKTNKSVSQHQMTLTISQKVCIVITDMAFVGFFNTKTLKFVKFGMKLLTTDIGSETLMPVSKLLFKHVCHGIYRLVEENNDDILKIVPDCYSKIIQCLNDEEFLDNIPTPDLKDVRCFLASSLQHLHQHNQLKELVSSITLIFIKSILNSILCNTEHWQDIEKKCNPFGNIPLSKFGAFLLSAVCVKPKMIVYFLQQLQKYLAKPGRDIQSWVACYVVVVNIWEIKNLSKTISKEMQSLVDKMEGLLLEHHPSKSADQNMPPMEEEEQDEDKEDFTPEAQQETEEALKSFGEHCLFEYQKLKILLGKTKVK